MTLQQRPDNLIKEIIIKRKWLELKGGKTLPMAKFLCYHLILLEFDVICLGCI